MKEVPELYADLREWVKYGDPIADFIDAFIEADDVDDIVGKGFTYAELREIMEKHYDAAYHPEDREFEVLPTQRQVNFLVEMLLADEEDQPVIYEKDGLIYMHRNEVEEQAIKNAILEILPRGSGDDGTPAS